MSKQLISLVEIADVICDDAGDPTKRFRSSILRHLATCYRTIQMFVNNETDIETVVCPISNVINMPSNFIYETKVGIKYGDRVVFLDKNYEDTGSTILSVNQTAASAYIDGMLQAECDTSIRTPFYNHRGELLYGYGHGIKCEGLYSVDKKNGRIIIGNMIPRSCEIVVEYVSDGVSQGLKMVPIEMYQVLYNYGLWKFFFQRKDNRWMQSAQDYDVAYYQLEMLYKFVPINYIVSLFQQETHTINDRL